MLFSQVRAGSYLAEVLRRYSDRIQEQDIEIKYLRPGLRLVKFGKM